MIERAERIADVVEQRHHDIFLIAAIAVRAGRGLQAMLEPIDRKAAIVAAEQLQMVEDAPAIVRGELLLLARDDVPVFLRPVDHRAEGRMLVRHVIHGSLS
jgi:hypothetical protein